MQFLNKEYLKLTQRKSLKGNAMPVSRIPKIKNHKLGISDNGLPLFFILCEDSKNQKSVDIDLELIRVEFDRKCELTTEQGKSIEGLYTIVSLKSNSIDIQQYFLDIVYLMLCNLPVKLKMKELKIELAKLVSLFSRLVEPPQKTIQGLWAELLVIERASNSAYLIDSWHINPTDKYDFNDGKDKLEVKSTVKNKRIHSFSIEQLNPNINSNLLIASVFTTQSGIGKSIFDLLELIEKKVNNTKIIFKLKENIAATLGKDFEKAQGVFYDYQFSVDNLLFFKSSEIPNIDLKHIPVEISNIHFDCDLTKVGSVKKGLISSKLHKSAF